MKNDDSIPVFELLLAIRARISIFDFKIESVGYDGKVVIICFEDQRPCNIESPADRKAFILFRGKPLRPDQQLTKKREPNMSSR